MGYAGYRGLFGFPPGVDFWNAPASCVIMDDSDLQAYFPADDSACYEVVALLFRKRKKPAPFPNDMGTDDEAQLYLIEFDMMLKGSIYKRRKGVVRQFGVTVNGATRLVTSGDVVDRETYRALMAAGAIRPEGPGAAGKRMRIVGESVLEQVEE